MNPRRSILLDRDGTILVERDYLSDPGDVELLPHAAAGLRRLAELGFALVVITNQSAIGRGYFDAQRLAEIHQRMSDLLARRGCSSTASISARTFPRTVATVANRGRAWSSRRPPHWASTRGGVS